MKNLMNNRVRNRNQGACFLELGFEALFLGKTCPFEKSRQCQEAVAKLKGVKSRWNSTRILRKRLIQRLRAPYILPFETGNKEKPGRVLGPKFHTLTDCTTPQKRGLRFYIHPNLSSGHPLKLKERRNYVLVYVVWNNFHCGVVF